MQAIKQYTEVVNGILHIDLPKSFTAKRVELIISSDDDSDSDSRKPITQARVDEAAKRLTLPEDEIRRRYEVLAPDFALKLEWLE